jgi:hypothetical protein
MKLPFPALQGYGQVSEETSSANPIVLRLEGSHVLAGLRTFVTAGLDCPLSKEDGEESTAAEGLPSWLTEIRGTRVTIGPDGQTEP